MAFLKFRGNTTTPTKPSSTTAANAPLSNVDIDGNFASLNDSKLEVSGHTQGDIFYANASGVIAKLARGSEGQALKISSNIPSWGTIVTTDENVKLEDVPTNTNTFYIPFALNSPGTSSLYTDKAGLKYRPSTDTLTVTNVSGNASTATAASSLNINAAAGGTFRFIIGTQGLGTPQTLSAAAGISYDASNNILLVSGIDIDAQQTSKIVDMSSSNTINCLLGNHFKKTISSNTTFSISNVPTGKAFSILVEVNHTSGSITWFSGVKWPNATAPSLLTGRTHLFVFTTTNGTVWYGASLTNYQ
jgi:hypothetical protein